MVDALSGVVTYFGSCFFIDDAFLPVIYITMIVLVLLSAIFLQDKSWYDSD